MKSFTVGSGGQADVIINQRGVSRVHLAVEVINDNQIALHDLNSTNGSFLMRGVGRISLSDKQIATRMDTVILGDYQITVEALLNQAPQETPANNQAAEPARSTQSTEPFSRYIRAEDGTFVRKT